MWNYFVKQYTNVSFYKTQYVSFRNFCGKLVNHDTWQNEISAVVEVKPLCYENAKEYFISCLFQKRDLRHLTGVCKIYQVCKFRSK